MKFITDKNYAVMIITFSIARLLCNIAVIVVLLYDFLKKKLIIFYEDIILDYFMYYVSDGYKRYDEDSYFKQLKKIYPMKFTISCDKQHNIKKLQQIIEEYKGKIIS